MHRKPKSCHQTGGETRLSYLWSDPAIGYPREVVKAALAANAAAVVFAHNHPAGIAQPTGADDTLTETLMAALILVGIKTLDHFIVAGNRTYSFAEQGRLQSQIIDPPAGKAR